MLGSAQSGYGKVLLVEGYVQGPQCSPKHNTFDSSGCLCLGDPPLPFLPRESKDKPWKHRLRERTNRRLPRQPSKKYSTSRCFAQRSSRARGLLNGWIQTALKNWVSPKKSPKKPINRVCLGEESTDESSRTSAPQVKGRQGWGFSNRDRVLMSSPLSQAVR